MYPRPGEKVSSHGWAGNCGQIWSAWPSGAQLAVHHHDYDFEPITASSLSVFLLIVLIHHGFRSRLATFGECNI
jgi:hypothetical protein